MNILVTGASGGYGSAALQYLKKFAPDANLYGLVRDPAKGETLKRQGIQVRIGDYADLNSMRGALKGIDRLLFVSSPMPDIQKNVVTAAKENDVQYIAYTSIFQPEFSKFGLEINHSQTEQWLRDSKIRYTFLRNSWYIEVNQAMFTYAKQTNRFDYFATKGKLSFALKREYAEAGARIIADGHGPAIANLANTPRSYAEIGEVIKQTLSKSLMIRQVAEVDFVPNLIQAGIDPNWANVAKTYQAYTYNGNNGEYLAEPTEFEQILGHPLTDLSTAIKELQNS